jgi:methylmalonyl-CoA/ethylmalonyl-CoA epimerase
MKINHFYIGVAVRNMEEAARIWGPLFGKSEPDEIYIHEPEKIRAARYWIGETAFELLESITPDGDVSKFIERNGEGVMVISVNVDNTQEAVDELKKKNYRFIGDVRPFGDSQYAFLHPKKMNGVMIELVDL